MKVKNNLLDIRLQLKYKYAKDFAQFLNIDSAQYTSYETNKRNISLINALSIVKKVKMLKPEIRFEDIFYLED